MKIGIDIRSAVGKKAGIGFYTMSIVTHLSKIDRKNQYILYTTEKVDWDLRDNFRQVVRPTSNILSKILYNIRLWADVQLFGKVDVFLSTNSLAVPSFSFLRKNVVLTIHDLVPLVMGETSARNVRWFFKLMPIATKLSSAIIVPSDATKNDLKRLLKVPENKIHFTSEGTNDWGFGKTTQKEIDRVVKKYGLPRKYFLFVSTLEPRKNIPNLIRAFSKFSKNDKQGFKLVIGGKKGWMYEEIFKVVKEENLEDKVIFTDYLPDEDMLPLYKGATAFTFVPFMEGFGLTPLEAMATGIPVMTSNCSSLPEVVGDAAILADPKDVDSIADGMRKLAEEEELRKLLVQKGLKQVKKFSWEKTARLTLAVLEKVGDRKSKIKNQKSK